MRKITAFLTILFVFASSAHAFPYEIGYVGTIDARDNVSSDESEYEILFPEADISVDARNPGKTSPGAFVLESGSGKDTYLKFDISHFEKYMTDCITDNCIRSDARGLGVFTLTTADPRIRFENLNIPYPELGICEVRIKNTSAATMSGIFLNRAEDTTYSSGRKVEIEITAHDTDYKTYYFDLSDHNAFTASDIINGIRFDFVEHAGESESGKKVYVDYVKLHTKKDYEYIEETVTEYAGDNCVNSSGTGLGKFTLRTCDPRIRFENQNIMCGNFVCAEVRMKNETSATQAAIYYKRKNDSNYAFARRIAIPITSDDTEYKTYRINIAGNPLLDYNDIITGVRLDFVEGAKAGDVGKSVWIDYVKFIRKEPDLKKLYNGYKAELELNPVESIGSKIKIYGISDEYKSKWNELSSYTNLKESGVTSAVKTEITSDSTVTFDVTDYVNSQTDGVYSFVIKNGGEIYSCEKSDMFSPKLIFKPYENSDGVDFGDTVDEIRVRKKTDDENDSVLIFAIYSKSGTLEKVHLSDMDVSELEAGSIKAVSALGYEIPESPDSIVKAFVWRNALLPVPLSDVYSIPFENDISYELEENFNYSVDNEKLYVLASVLNSDIIGTQAVSLETESDKSRFVQDITEHFKSRENPLYFYDVKNKSEKILRLRKDIAYSESIVAEAERIMGYKPYMWGSNVDFENSDVWDYRICVPGYYTYGSMINRFEWLIPVAQSYWITGNEKYARFATDILSKWIKANQPASYEPQVRGQGECGLPWNDTLDIGIRLQNFCRIFQYVRCCDSFDAELYVDFLCSIYDHTKILMAQEKNGFFGGNWQTQECEGLVQAAVLFPEFKDSLKWHECAMSLVALHTEEPKTMSDGTYLEPTPDYFSNVRQNLFNIIALSKMNGFEVDSGVSEPIEKMFEWFMGLTLSDTYMPVPGDTSKINQQKYLAFGAALFNRGDMKFVSGLDKLPGEFIWMMDDKTFEVYESLPVVKPANSHTLLPDSQYIVMRDDWANLGHGNSLFFDINPIAKGHNHYDYLNIEAVFGGERLITEPAHMGYSHPQRTVYGVGAIGHNVALIDDGAKQNTWITSPAPEITGTYFSDEYDYAEGKVVYPSDETASGYEWRRAVVYLKPDVYVISDVFTGSGSHNIKRLFHTPAQNECELLSNNGGAKITGKNKSVYIVPSAATGLKVSDDDGLGEFTSKLDVVILETDSKFPCRMTTVVADSKGGIPIITDQGSGSYKVVYGNDEWNVNFGSDMKKTTVSVKKHQ